MGTVCLALGFMVTSALGPRDDVFEIGSHVYDIPPAGVLNDPSGFGIRPEQKKRPGIIGSDIDEEVEEPSNASNKKPTVGGALSDLHHAVSDKVQSWNPYFVKSASQDHSSASNGTTKQLGEKNKAAALLTGESVKDGISEEERLGARTRIGKATILFSGNSFWERCIRTHEQHDKVHGYRLHVLRQQLMDDVWSKPAYILSLLLRELSKHESERLDWLFWVDADTIILNPYVPIETFLPPGGTEFDDVYLMYSNDWNGLNNGVFPIRVNQWAVKMFAAIVAYRHFNPNDPLIFRDQSAMNTLMQEPEFAKHIMQAPQRWFNAYQGEHNETLQPFQVRRGDLLVHFAGVPAREERMQYWLKRAEQHLDDWEVPVKSTSYIQEARDFWNEQREIRKNRNIQVEEARERARKLLFTTDQNLNDYGDRLEDDQRLKIGMQRDDLRMVIEQEPTKNNLEKIEERMNGLTDISKPLITVIAQADKQLLQSAHEAIFAGEKDLLDGGFGQSASSPEMEEISTQVQNLKALVMAPPEGWNRNDIKSAINDVTESRAKLQGKLAADIEAQKQALEQEAANAQLLEAAIAGAQQGADEVDAVENELGTGTELDTGVEFDAGPELGTENVGDAVDYVVVTAPGPTYWTTEVVTSTSTGDTSPTAIQGDGRRF
jgi:hypothetical protein